MDKFETWDVKKASKSHCYWLEYDWCEYLKTKCIYEICPMKIKSSHRYTDTHGKTIEHIKER